MSCPDCFSGSVHEGTPRGTTARVHGLDAYVSEPTNGRPVEGIIVILPDAFGWEFANNRLLADHFAEKGSYKVYLPEFMNGCGVPPWALGRLKSVMSPGNYLRKPIDLFWLLRAMVPFMYGTRPAVSYPVVRKFFQDLRKAEGATLPVGAAGYCWGGWMVVKLASGHDGAVDTANPAKPLLIDAGFTGHPSRLAIPADIEPIAAPVSFACPETDSQVPPDKIAEIRRVVETDRADVPGGAAKARGEVRVYEGTNHGFCVRADLQYDESAVAKQADDAEDQCISWFNKHFGLGGK